MASIIIITGDRVQIVGTLGKGLLRGQRLATGPKTDETEQCEML